MDADGLHGLHRAVSILLVLCVLTLGACARAKPPRIAVPPATAEADAPSAEDTQPPVPSQVAEVSSPEAEPVETEPAEQEAQPTEPPSEPDTATPESPPTATWTALPEATATPLPSDTPTPEPTPVPTGEVTYVVKHGDTLGTIARLHGTTSIAIMQANGLYNPNMIRVGQKLVIPMGDVSVQSLTGKTIAHLVSRGETLSYLARRYQTTIAAIRAQNPTLTDLNRLTPGSKLSITVGDEPAMIMHKVRPGESLSGIAARYGVSTATITRANGLQNPNQLYVGQVLVIPTR